MASPSQQSKGKERSSNKDGDGASNSPSMNPARAESSTLNAPPTPGQSEAPPSAQKKRRNRGGRKKRNRRQSFAAAEDEDGGLGSGLLSGSQHNLLEVPNSNSRPNFYRLGQSGANLSNTSLESEALLDHREQQPLRPRRQSVMLGRDSFGPRPGTGRVESGRGFEGSSSFQQTSEVPDRREHRPWNRPHYPSGYESEDVGAVDDKTPLISSSHRARPSSRGYGGSVLGGRSPVLRGQHGHRDSSAATSTSSRRKRRPPLTGPPSSSGPTADYDINNPPSVPSSPKIGPDVGYGDVMVAGDFAHSRYPDAGESLGPIGRDSIINIDADQRVPHPSPPSSQIGLTDYRRGSIAFPAEGDVCFPVEGMSEMGEENGAHLPGGPSPSGTRRRRLREWPDLSVLDDWSREEKEQRGEIRTKRISEPVLVGGRLRPNKGGWHRTEEDAPYRFTYFNEEFASTIHSQTISELLQPGQTFREFFIPDPPVLSDESSDENEELELPLQESRDGNQHNIHQGWSANGEKVPPREASALGENKAETRSVSGDAAPLHGPETGGKMKRFGGRPTFWLDVLSPTDAEMRVLSKTFGIHPLTAEDIMMQEAREKVELFRNYYFVNYRTFEQDMNSEHFLEPVDMYVVCFREGVISFHFSMVPHAANVRRRVRQLKDYLILSSDWISYAIIDDITDAFAPLIQSVEDEVDDIDDAILQLHSPADASSPSAALLKNAATGEKRADTAELTVGESGGDMLRRVGDCRKKVMGLYRLLGNKADVIKGFAKRCNEQWEIAPRSEIGLYLGDIQDHIITMTSNLSHYEKILSRSHSNYLAQINIRMNERQEQTADVLGRLTVLGTIVLPMNIITGLWGMNCLVPGQDADSLTWFWGVTAGLLVFGFMCYFIAKRVYGIV